MPCHQIWSAIIFLVRGAIPSYTIVMPDVVGRFWWILRVAFPVPVLTCKAFPRGVWVAYLLDVFGSFP